MRTGRVLFFPMKASALGGGYKASALGGGYSAVAARRAQARALVMTVSALGGYSPSTLLGAPKHEPLEVALHVASGRSVHLSKSPGESVEHLILKGLLWALLVPSHPTVMCEVDLGLRYKPDVVVLDAATGEPCWWGECGHVKPSKLADLGRAFPYARFSVAKWGRGDLRGYAGQLRSQLRLPARAAPFDLISFPADSIERFIRDDGLVSVGFDELQIVPLMSEDPT